MCAASCKISLFLGLSYDILDYVTSSLENQKMYKKNTNEKERERLHLK